MPYPPFTKIVKALMPANTNKTPKIIIQILGRT